MASGSGKRSAFSLKKKIFFTCLIMLAILVLSIEVVFRVFEIPGFDRFLLTLDPVQDARVIPHPYLGFMLKPDYKRNKFKHNSLGYRGPEITLKKPPGVYRIACIGGSSTYGHGPTSQAKTWPALLETKLRKAYPGQPIQVINCGTSGYSSFENMINLSLRIVDLEPDLIILYQTINDMHCGLTPTPYSRDNRHWRAVLHLEPKTDWERLLEKSMTYLVYRRLFTDYMSPGDLGTSTIVNYGVPYMPEKAHPEEIECFRRNLRSMIAVAREFGAEVMISTQACYLKHLHTKSEREGIQIHAKVLRRIAKEYECHFIDNASPSSCRRTRNFTPLTCI